MFDPISSDSALFFRFTGYGLKCYKCFALSNWDDCEKDRVETTCLPGFDSCGKVFFDGKVGGLSFKSYYKDCSVKAGCNNDQCKALAQAGATIDDCEVSCCEGDLCNGAKVPLVSAFLLWACALLAFFR